MIKLVAGEDYPQTMTMAIMDNKHMTDNSWSYRLFGFYDSISYNKDFSDFFRTILLLFFFQQKLAYISFSYFFTIIEIVTKKGL